MRRVGVAGVVTMLLTVLSLGCDSADEPGSSVPSTPTSFVETVSPDSVDGRFVPPTRVEGDVTVMPVTLPNGGRFEVRYPAALDLAGLGFKPVTYVEWPVRPDPLRCCGKAVGVSYQSLDEAWHGEPITTYPGPDEHSVPYLPASAAGRTVALDYLVFEFGPWLVEVHDLQQSDPSNFEDRMTEEERATWALSLQGHRDPSGFLLLDPKPPLVLGQLEHFVLGPADDRVIEVAAEYCGMPDSDGPEPRYFPDPAGAGAAWCDPDSGLHVSVTGPDDFVERVVTGLRIDRIASPQGR